MKAVRYKCEIHGDRLSDGCCPTCERLYWESDEGKADMKDTNMFPVRW